MMQLTFLKAADDTPLTKIFTKTKQGVELTANYPQVRNVTSMNVEVDGPQEFYEALDALANEGLALMKGPLTRALHNESRAGLMDLKAPTEFFVLDLDFDDGFDSIHDAITAISPELAKTDYIIQHSASAGLTKPHGLRSHVFFLLEGPLSPGQAKTWTCLKNLNTPVISDRIELTNSNNALSWPLDPCICQNDKPLFVAPPTCKNFDDPLAGKRIQLVTNERRKVPLDAFDISDSGDLVKLTQGKLNELRAKAGLDTYNPKTRPTSSGLLVLSNPNPCEVSGIKEERGFTYLNLNGGDSWAYYFPSNNPTIVYNFKDESPARLKDLAPDFWRQLRREEATPDCPDTRKFFAFIETNTDEIRRGWYDPTLGESWTVPCSRQSAMDWLASVGEPKPDSLPNWTIEFDPSTLTRIDETKRWINTFKPTPYMLLEADQEATLPPVTEKVLRNICVDDETFQHFINWLAYVFQTRDKSQTAWVFHGTTGTGKGVLFERILKPLFGPNHVIRANQTRFQEQYNGFLEHAIFVFVDEVSQESGRAGERMAGLWRELITERTLTIRAMRANPTERASYCNVIFATNQRDPINIGNQDRRHNVAPAQYSKLKLTNAELDSLYDLTTGESDELETLAKFLKAYKVNTSKVTKPLLNQARMNMIRDSQTTTELFFYNIEVGNFDYIGEEYFGLESGDPNTFGLRSGARKVIQTWARDLLKNRDAKLEADDLNTVYSALHGTNRMSPKKFTRMANLHLPAERGIARLRVDGAKKPCVPVYWASANEELIDEILGADTEPKDKVLPFKKSSE